VVNSSYAMLQRLKAAWNWLPVIVRAIILGFVVLTIGSTVTFLPLLGNLKFHPEIPWAFPMTVVVLAIYGAYFSGWGPPAGTRDARKRLARASLPSARIWRAAIPAMVFGIIALVALRLLLPSLMPVRAPSVSIALSSYSLPTIIGALLSIATIAGVTEEIAFRGYMQKLLEEAYGIVPAVLIVGIMFWVAHLDHGITITHLPFQMSASIALGLLAYLTRSLIPAMIAHGAADILLQPAYLLRHPEFVWKALSARPVWEGVTSTFPGGTINNRTGAVAQTHVCRRPISNLHDRRLGRGDKHTARRVCLHQPATGKPIECIVTPQGVFGFQLLET
jgi:membrane protease YdiL (CAAX protease family)